MKIVIVGLGGVGGIVGGRLAAGLAEHPEHEIVFWCRGKTCEAIAENGLTVLNSDERIVARPALATSDPGDVGTADVLIFATKGYHLDAAAEQLAPAASEKTVVIPLLNGVSAASVLKKHLPESDVLGGCIYVSAHVENPGTVRQIGAVQRIIFGKRGIGEAENLMRYGAVDQVLQKSGISITLTDRIDVEMWSKFIFLSPFAGTTTLYRRSIGEVLSEAESFEMTEKMIAELEALGRAKKVSLPENIAGLTVEKARAFAPHTKTSMQLDQEKGNATELESLIGYVCREAQDLGVPVPTYDRAYAELKKICKS